MAFANIVICDQRIKPKIVNLKSHMKQINSANPIADVACTYWTYVYILLMFKNRTLSGQKSYLHLTVFSGLIVQEIWNHCKILSRIRIIYSVNISDLPPFFLTLSFLIFNVASVIYNREYFIFRIVFKFKTFWRF